MASMCLVLSQGPAVWPLRSADSSLVLAFAHFSQFGKSVFWARPLWKSPVSERQTHSQLVEGLQRNIAKMKNQQLEYVQWPSPGIGQKMETKFKLGKLCKFRESLRNFILVNLS